METSKDDGEGGGGGGAEQSGVNQEMSTGGSSSIVKSCKGTLYYSSVLKSKGRSPRCVGFSRTLLQAPSYVVSESEANASKQDQIPADFQYACLGYAVFSDNKDPSADVQKPQVPLCAGFELLVEKIVPASDHSPAHVHAREDDRGSPQPQPHKPIFLARFTRNANLVASGVAWNLQKVGNHIKGSIYDIFYPYPRRPK